MPKKRKKLKGKVDRIIKPALGEPEKAQISIREAEHLYREIRVPNKWTDDKGADVAVKPGTEIEVTLEAADSDVALKMPASLESFTGDGTGPQSASTRHTSSNLPAERRPLTPETPLSGDKGE